jgi:multiple sugar transport system permease protein
VVSGSFLLLLGLCLGGWWLALGLSRPQGQQEV